MLPVSVHTNWHRRVEIISKCLVTKSEGAAPRNPNSGNGHGPRPDSSITHAHNLLI
jgi:hypothetical protein